MARIKPLLIGFLLLVACQEKDSSKSPAPLGINSEEASGADNSSTDDLENESSGDQGVSLAACEQVVSDNLVNFSSCQVCHGENSVRPWLAGSEADVLKNIQGLMEANFYKSHEDNYIIYKITNPNVPHGGGKEFTDDTLISLEQAFLSLDDEGCISLDSAEKIAVQLNQGLNIGSFYELESFFGSYPSEEIKYLLTTYKNYLGYRSTRNSPAGVPINPISMSILYQLVFEKCKFLVAGNEFANFEDDGKLFLQDLILSTTGLLLDESSETLLDIYDRALSIETQSDSSRYFTACFIVNKSELAYILK